MTDITSGALRLDPRTKVALVLASSVVVMTPGGAVFVPAVLVLAVLLAATEGAWLRMAALPVAAAAAGALAYVLPIAIHRPVVGVIGVVAAYLLRLIAMGGIAAHLVRTTVPGELTAALRTAHVPRAITVPAAVMLRFLPTVLAEGRSIRDAMRLRGIGGLSGLLRHPIQSVEHFTVPLIASSLLVAEDLSASALLRGLGSRTTPTTMYPCRFGAADAFVAVTVVFLVVCTLWPGWPR